MRFFLTFSSGSCVSEGLLSSDGRESNCSCMYIHIHAHVTTIIFLQHRKTGDEVRLRKTEVNPLYVILSLVLRLPDLFNIYIEKNWDGPGYEAI